MTKGNLDDATLATLAKICGRFGSDQDGERATAALTADRIVRKAGTTWDDLLRPQPQSPSLPTCGAPSTSWRAMIRACRKCPRALTRHDRELLNAVEEQAGPTEAQRRRLQDLYLKVKRTAGRGGAR